MTEIVRGCLKKSIFLPGVGFARTLQRLIGSHQGSLRPCDGLTVYQRHLFDASHDEDVTIANRSFRNVATLFLRQFAKNLRSQRIVTSAQCSQPASPFQLPGLDVRRHVGTLDECLEILNRTRVIAG